MYEPKKGSSDLKDRKVSCAECRRSKLKCDRVFPCQSCIRRGCAEICPDGTLAATKGNKVLMAHAQKLTEQVKLQVTRIKELEHALSDALASAGSDGAHPLLQQSTPGKASDGTELDIVYDAGLQDVSDAIGSLAIGVEGQARYHGETASSEYFHDMLASPEEYQAWRPQELGLPFEIIELMNSFPLGLRNSLCTKRQFLSFLPTREIALTLTDIYYKNVAWMYDPIVRHDFMNNVISPIYGDNDIANLDTIHSHRLSVFFILLASGYTYDTHPSATFLAEQYHALARAALSLDPVLQEATCSTVQALFMMVRFIYNTDRMSNETRWMLMGLCTRVAQMIGLQRDSAGWNLDHAEVQRRRVLFWELYTYDAWTSVVNGRPPSLQIQHADCRFPDDLEPSRKPSGDHELGWHAWKFRYSASCLSISVQHAFTITRAPNYAALLELDKKIRKFPLPSHLQSPDHGSDRGRVWLADPVRAMQQYCVVCERESNLLYIHRSFFAQAIREESRDPLKHKYAASVLNTYRSACTLISSLKGLYPLHPTLTSKIWFFWSGIFSACIVLGALVVESPGFPLAHSALQELEQALSFYDTGSAPCRPPSTLTTIQNLCQRAYSTYHAFHSGLALKGNSDRQIDPTIPDELEVLGGRKSVITTKSTSGSPASHPSSASPPLSQSGRDDLAAQFVGDPHPSLMDYYDDLCDPTRNDHEMAKAFANVDTYIPPGPRPSGMAIQESQPYNPSSQQMEFSQYQPAPQWPHPQQALNSLGFVAQEDVWREFTQHLGVTR